MRRIRAASWFGPTLAGLMLLALLLRVWGSRTGLPYVYNVDEGAHFVPRAVGMFDHNYDPAYFINPPALTYVFHVLFWLRWGGEKTRELATTDPTALFAFARVAVGVLATASVGLLAWAGARLFDRRVAIVAAALLAVAFLPVHYGHFALNDAALVGPVCLSLAGSAGILDAGRRRDFLVAGLGLGIAVAFKYTAGMAVVPIIAATLLGPGDKVRGALLAAAAAAAAFLVLNPYALLSFQAFHAGLADQSDASSEVGGKLGLPLHHGVLYYAETLLWGLGVIPLISAVGGGMVLWLRDYRRAMLLLPGPILFLLFMGSEDRFFARWSLPAYPFLALLAAWGAVRAFEQLKRLPAWAPVALAALALGVQGLVYAVHNDVILTRSDTRESARAWMVSHIPAGAKVVIEPMAPDAWGQRWRKRAVSHFRITTTGKKALIRDTIKLENYEQTLRPDLIGSYLRGGYCWVVTGSILYGRPYVTPGRAPFALKYYRALRRMGTVEYAVSPAAGNPAFSFDDSYNWRPLSYHRPGPRIVIYRLHGGRCG